MGTDQEDNLPTDIAAYLWSTLAAENMRMITPDEAQGRIEKTLAALATRWSAPTASFSMESSPGPGHPLTVWPADGKPVRRLLSTVDNGWLAAALHHDPQHPTRHSASKPNAFPGRWTSSSFTSLMTRPTRSSTRASCTWIYCPRHRQLRRASSGLVNTEPRIASYIGIARRQLPPEHYFRIGRTLPHRGAQKQVPQGETPDSTWGSTVFEGHYTYRGMRIVPSWGGSMFEALMVPLFVPEARWAPRSWGVNHPLTSGPRSSTAVTRPATASGASLRRADPRAVTETTGLMPWERTSTATPPTIAPCQRVLEKDRTRSPMVS